MNTPKPLCSLWLKMLSAAALMAAMPAAASTFSVTGSGSTFTVTRSGEGTNAAETVRYRTVSRSAFAGTHFMDGAGILSFAAGELSKSVQISERSAAEVADLRFLYCQSGGATGSSRTYRFEVVDDGGFPLASADRAISYDSSKFVSSSAYAEKSVTVTNGEILVKGTGFAQAYHAVPLNSYFTSTVPKEYLAATHANLRMLFDFQAEEEEDGYQYIQILINQTSSCDAPGKNAVSGGDPGYTQISRYMAGFDHRHGHVGGNFEKYTFPVVSTNDNCGATQPWSGLGNNVGDLCVQRFNTGCRAADGRLVVPVEIDSLGIRFTASGDGHDDWTAKSVVARIQAVPSTPSLLDVAPAVTPSPVCKGSMVSVSLPFSEVVTVSGTPTLSTTWGNLPYVAGSGANVLTFAGPVTASSGTQLQITGLSGTVRGLTGTAFTWPGSITVSGRSVEQLPTPPRSGLIYQLSTPLHLRWFADKLASAPQTSAALADDIDLSTIDSFVPMGGTAGFKGTFDGRGHALSGLSITTSDAAGRVGLFGLVASQGTVTNLVLTNVTVSSSSPSASLGILCGRNLGTITFCSVFGRVMASSRNTNGAGSAMGGVCGENAGTIRTCRVEDALTVGDRTLDNDWNNMTVGGIAGTNAVSGTIKSCLFYARYENDGANVVHGAVCGANAGTVRNCVGVHSNRNYFNGSVGVNSGTVDNTLFPDPGNVFTNGAACYALNGGVTDGSQHWYQLLGTDALPQLSITPNPGATVYLYGDTCYNAWNLLQTQLNAGGVVTLANDVTVLDSDSTLTVSNTVTLDLNGHTIDAAGRFRVFMVGDGGHLTLTNSQPSTLNSQPSTITGGNAENGGGVYVDAGGAFTMAGGEISGNTALQGGGVYVAQDGMFTVSGSPVISGNTNDVGAANNVYLPDGRKITVAEGGLSGGLPSEASAKEGASIGVTLDSSATSQPVAFATGASPGDKACFFSDSSGLVVDYKNGELRLRPPTQWTLLQEQLDAGGTVALTNDVTATAFDVPLTVTTAVTLDLNGHVIRGNRKRGIANGGIFYVGAGGDFTLTNRVEGVGAITGGDAENGGGVYVAGGGAFTMAGGEITDNVAQRGGGVYVAQDGMFTVSGSPVISGNTNTLGNAKNVYSLRPIVVNGLSAGASIGVSSTTTLIAGTFITFATDVSAGDEAYFTSDNPALSIENANGQLRLWKQPTTQWGLLQAQLSLGGVVTLTNDVTATSGDVSLTVANAVTLDLNGHVITGNGKKQVLSVVDGGDLTLTNSQPSTLNSQPSIVTGGGDHGVYVGEDSVFRLRGGAIAGNESGYAGGGVFVDRGTFEMTGGMITNNAAYDNNVGGGGVFVFDGTFTMTGGEISGNTAINGGGVFVAEHGEFTMSGGEISDNTADEGCGGGVCLYNGGVFTMSGGAISGNTALEGSCVAMYRGEFTMTGGTISGNTVVWNGGVYVCDGTFTVSGSPVVSGNTNWDGEAGNVYLCSGSVIAVDGLSAGASIGVTTENEPPATITSGASAGDSQYFFSDNPDRRVEQTDGEVIMGLAYPAYLVGADEAVTNKWCDWARMYGVGTNAEYEAAFLLNISPLMEITPDESLLKIVEFGTTNILVSESGGYGILARTMGYEGEYLTFRRIVLASDVTDLWQDDWGDAREICNGYLVLRTTADLSLPKSGWEAISLPVEFENGRAVVMFPEMFEESIRGYFESVGGKTVNGLSLRACIEIAPVENPALVNVP